MWTYKYLVWNCGKARSTVLEALDTPAAISAAEDWARDQDWGFLDVIRLHVAKMNLSGNIMNVELVHVDLGLREPDLRRELDEMIDRWKAKVTSDTPDLALLRHLRDCLGGFGEESKDTKRRHEAAAKTMRECYIGPRYVYDVRDDKWRHFVVAGSVNEALGLCNLYTGQILIRRVPWDQEITTPGRDGVTKTVQQWAHTTKVGVFLSETPLPKES